MSGNESIVSVAELALLIVAVGGVAWCFATTILRNNRQASAKRQRRTTVKAQERAAKIMRERRINERYAAMPAGDPYSR